MSSNLTMHPVLEASAARVEKFQWGELHWFVSGSIGNSQTTTVGRCILKPGHENPRHIHPNCEEILQVVSGSIMHSLGDEMYPMNPGDAIAIPQNIVHNAKNVGTEEAVLTIVFSSAYRETQGEV